MNLHDNLFNTSVSSELRRRIVRMAGVALCALTFVSLAAMTGPEHDARAKAAAAMVPKAEAPAKPAAEGVVNINTATPEQLTYLPGIGPSRAEKIVMYRTKRPFKNILHLARVKGIGLKTVRTLKPYLTVSGQTTLSGPVGGKKRAKKRKASKAEKVGSAR